MRQHYSTLAGRLESTNKLLGFTLLEVNFNDQNNVHLNITI